jgi:DNA-binding MarR family transcriptional regulator
MSDPDSDSLSKRRLKMWVRLLGVTRSAQSHMREFLRVKHNTTLPRFDVMAALHRRPDGVTMSELSRLLLVSNGNATAVVDRLERDGLVRRTTSTTDRRTIFVTLTAAGIRQFEVLAVEHEHEVNVVFGGLSEIELETVTAVLKRLGHGDAATRDSPQGDR